MLTLSINRREWCGKFIATLSSNGKPKYLQLVNFEQLSASSIARLSRNLLKFLNLWEQVLNKQIAAFNLKVKQHDLYAYESSQYSFFIQNQVAYVFKVKICCREASD